MTRQDQEQLFMRVSSLLLKLTTGTSTTSERQETAKELAAFVDQQGVFSALFEFELAANLHSALAHVNGAAHEGVFLALAALGDLSSPNIARACEPHLLQFLPNVLIRLSDKSNPVRQAANLAATAVVKGALSDNVGSSTGGQSLSCVLRVLYDGMSNKHKFQTITGSLKLLSLCVTLVPHDVFDLLPDIIPHVTECMFNIDKRICQAGMATMKSLAAIIGNPDMDHLIPLVVDCVANPERVPIAIEQMARTTFVKRVTAPALAIIMFPLERGLATRTNIVLRQTAVIIDNMCRLVEDPADIEPFFERLMTGLERIVETGASPDLRATAAKAMITLYKLLRESVPEYLVTIATEDNLQPVLVDVSRLPTKRDLAAIADRLHELKARNAGKLNADDHLLSAARNDTANSEKRANVTANKVADCIRLSIKKAKLEEHTFLEDPLIDKAIRYISSVCLYAIHRGLFDMAQWQHRLLIPYLTAIIAPQYADTVAPLVYQTCLDLYDGKCIDTDDFDTATDGEDLCDCEFSLAYGGKILLKQARLHLRRGHRYGLCGHNGVGKTTLMTAIAKGQLEGFPPADQLRTVFVGHDLDSSDAAFSSVDFLLNDARLRALKVTKAQVEAALNEFDFPRDMQQQSVGALSGGWKCKLAIARAILLKADILLLDEPTNHLDTAHVAWLSHFLTHATDKTSLIVSHDSTFLDNVCDHIIDYENKKLVTYKGNLSQFVKAKPAARAYYSLQETRLVFNFPKPGLLNGVGTKRKPVIRMTNVNYTYPDTKRQILYNVNVSCCLASRVAVKGVNGAGKSTLIKLLIGHLSPRPGEGQIKRHPTLRLQYVAQHAFHHVELHVDKSPAEYLRWRFENDQDKELLAMDTRKLSPEEEAQMERDVILPGDELQRKRRVGAIIGRAKHKKSFQYEVIWVGMPAKYNTWMPREDLEALGFTKLVQSFDDKESAREGLSGSGIKSLTSATIQKHFEEFGLESEFSVHGRIGDLSGGQKVRTVLAAAMWLNPHMLILDEPSNYLDRDAIGALVDAIHRYEGGVVVISHNSEFTDAICGETWHVIDGKVTVENKNKAPSQSVAAAAALSVKEDEDDTDLLIDVNDDGTINDKTTNGNSTNGTTTNGRASPALKVKKLSRKQQKEEEYRQERQRLAELGILPD